LSLSNRLELILVRQSVIWLLLLISSDIDADSRYIEALFDCPPTQWRFGILLSAFRVLY